MNKTNTEETSTSYITSEQTNRNKKKKQRYKQVSHYIVKKTIEKEKKTFLQRLKQQGEKVMTRL